MWRNPNELLLSPVAGVGVVSTFELLHKLPLRPAQVFLVFLQFRLVVGHRPLKVAFFIRKLAFRQSKAPWLTSHVTGVLLHGSIVSVSGLGQRYPSRPYTGSGTA